MTFHLKRDALGMGDVKLMVGGGLWIGFLNLPFAILLSCISGFFNFMILAIFKKKSIQNQEIPFGPHLVLGLLVVKIPFAKNILSMLMPF